MRSHWLTQRRMLVLVVAASLLAGLLPDAAGRAMWNSPRQIKDMLITPLTHPLHQLSLRLRGPSAEAVTPIAAATVDAAAAIEERRWYATQVQRLKAELRDAYQRLERYERHAELARRSGAALDGPAAYTTAHVTAWGGRADQPTLTLNKGRSHGLRPGMVVCDEVSLVGRIVDVGAMTSTVALLTVPGRQVPARIIPADQPAADGLPMVLRYDADREVFWQITEITTSVDVGDLAHLDDTSTWPPEAWGLLVGQVTAVERDDDPLNFKRLIVQPVIRAAYLRRVTILIPRED
jgi:cell shape-determining protein MreC